MSSNPCIFMDYGGGQWTTLKTAKHTDQLSTFQVTSTYLATTGGSR